MNTKPSLWSFAAAFRAHWFAAMSGGFSVPFTFATALVDSTLVKGILLTLAFCGAWFAAYAIWKFEREKVIDLEEKLRPKIKVVGIHERRNSLNAERTFELEIKNDSEDELANCLAKVTAISVFKINLDGKQIDYSAPYRRDLPLGLKTARNLDHDGEGPFHLRAHETKKVLIFSRQDGIGKDLRINFESGAPEYLQRITVVSTCDLDIEIYGAPSPPRERLHLAISSNGESIVTRSTA
jgi:hypothetical protein